MKKLETFDLSYFRGKNHFEDNDTQHWLVFQPINRYFKAIVAGNRNNLSWKYNECINPPTTPDKILNPLFNYAGTKARAKLRGDCLKQERVTFNHGKIVNIYIVFEIEKNVNISSYPTLENCFFGAFKLAKHIDVPQYKYSVYSIRFGRKWFFSHPSGGTGKNVIIFGVEMSSTTKIDKWKKGILILGKGPTRGLEHTLSERKKMLKKIQSFVWACIITEQTATCLLMVNKFTNL